MRLLMSLPLIALMAGAAAAQSLSVIDYDGPRAGVLADLEAGRLDVDASVDSPVLLGGIRFRAGIGHGRWENEWEHGPPLSLEPRVTRLAGSLLFVRRDGSLTGHFGVGLAAYLPKHVELRAQRGLRLTGGMGYSGERWAIGPELEIDLPHPTRILDARVATRPELLPTFRLGLAVKRVF